MLIIVPNDILSEIFDYLSFSDIGETFKTCKIISSFKNMYINKLKIGPDIYYHLDSNFFYIKLKRGNITYDFTLYKSIFNLNDIFEIIKKLTCEIIRKKIYFKNKICDIQICIKN